MIEFLRKHYFDKVFIIAGIKNQDYTATSKRQIFFGLLLDKKGCLKVVA